MRALGIDVGGTFTDAVLVSDGEIRIAKVPTAELQGLGRRRCSRCRCDLRRPLHPRHHDRDQCAPRTARGAHCSRNQRGLRTRPAAPSADPRAPLSAVRRASAAARAAGSLCGGPWSNRLGGRARSARPQHAAGHRRRGHRRLAALLLPRQRTREGCGGRAAPPLSGCSRCRSHEVAPEFREYERASTTAIDAYLGPVLARYLGGLAEACAAAGLPTPLVMRSSGGLATLDEAAGHAAFALLSGPAAGVVGAAKLAALAGFANALSFDMGGTSTDVCAIVDGEARREHERLVGGLPVRLPTLAVHTVGAGGGSIVWLDEGGALRVGRRTRAEPRPPATGGVARAPRSPMPHSPAPDACRRCQVESSSMPAAERALEDRRGRGDRRVVNAEMVRALRVVSVEQVSTRGAFALSPSEAPGRCMRALADELGMTTVLVPASAGALSALGLVAADERRDSTDVRLSARRRRRAPRRRRGGPAVRRAVVRADRATRRAPRGAIPRRA